MLAKKNKKFKIRFGNFIVYLSLVIKYVKIEN